MSILGNGIRSAGIALSILSAGLSAAAAEATTDTYSIDKTPWDAGGPYTINEHRAYIVAGCVPHSHPFHFPSGSSWDVCNDLDYIKDKVVQSDFISCLDYFPNGVLQEIRVQEVNNRTWQSFRFSCRNLESDGTIGAASLVVPFLFNYTKNGDPYATEPPTNHLVFGIFEVWNKLELRQSLLSIGLDNQSANAIYESGQKNKYPDDWNVSDRIPPAYPLLIGSRGWDCPPGMAMTGAAIGHIPKENGKDTRPVYILAECRRLLRD